MEQDLITTKNGWSYIYIPQEHTFHLLPQECIPYWIGEKNMDHSYESRKVEFFRKLQKGKHIETFVTKYSPNNLKKNLINLDHLLIEVTDSCNLACKYCGYGELYGNYDTRENKNNTFSNVKALIDYLFVLWNSNQNLSFNKTCYIGFYGGEPLMNFNLIKHTIEYIEKLSFHNNLKFEYNMTTNAMLLNKHIEYLVDKKFHLLISIDGNEYNNSYRLTKNNHPSFFKVFENIKDLQNKYPHYFEQYVSFNAVLHNRNSVLEILSFIKENFHKTPTISPLTTNGIKKTKQKEFMSMFNNPLESYKRAISCEKINIPIGETPDSSMANFFINAYCTQTFKKYNDLFLYEKDKKYLPTGTCTPLKRKLFLTVNGKLLPCERIGQELSIGKIIDKNVVFDFDKISNLYQNLFNKILPLCKNCALNKACGLCIFHNASILNKNKIHCIAYTPKQKQSELFKGYLYYFELNRAMYEQVINKMILI